MNVSKESGNPVHEHCKAYEINSRHWNLDISDAVTPDTIIGFHYKTNRLIRARRFGRIATLYHNPIHDSLIVIVVTGGDWILLGSEKCPEEERLSIPGLYLG